jgi:hypothetical protein
MRGSIGGVMALVVAAGMALPVSAQVERCEYLIAHGAIIVYKPYRVEYRISERQLQKDGETKAVEFTQAAVIGLQGVWMNSRADAPSPEEESPSTNVCVYDPIAGLRTTWSAPGKQATRMRIAEIEASHSSCAKKGTFEAELSRAKPVVEDLGTETIQGYVAHGVRTSRSFPTLVNGKSKTIVRSVEIWRTGIPGLNGAAGIELTDHDHLDDPWFWSKSEKLAYFRGNVPEFFEAAHGSISLLVRELVDDPRYGSRSEELHDFRQDDPGSVAFQPPEGYKIVMKKAPASACPSEKDAATTEPPPLPAE